MNQKVKEKERQAVNQAATDPNKPPVVAAQSLPSTAVNFEGDAGKGIEGADKDSYAIPFLMILQPLSPVVSESLVEGAKAGMLMNSVTQDLYKENTAFIPCAFQRRWIRWQSRQNGGGFKGEFSTAQVQEIRARGEVRELDGRLFYPLPDGSVNPEKCDRLSDTRSHFGLVLPTPDAEFGFPVVFALASTGIKVSKNFMSRIEGIRLNGANGPFNPPSFSHIYSIKTEMQKNDKGTWWQPVISILGPVQKAALYAQAKAFYAQVTAGQVQAAHESVARAGGVEGEAGAGASGGEPSKGF